MVPLTKRQREILDYLTSYIDDHGFAPSFEEIAAAMKSLTDLSIQLNDTVKVFKIPREGA